MPCNPGKFFSDKIELVHIINLSLVHKFPGFRYYIFFASEIQEFAQG